MASKQEIEEAAAAVREDGRRELELVHCISSYPAPIEQTNLLQIPELAKNFGVLSGLSDHTIGTTVAVAAVALGACVIQKHFTLSRTVKGPDREFSLGPDELGRLCRDAKDAWLSLGRAGFDRKSAEDGRKVFRRSTNFVRDLPAGAVVGPGDIRRIRPGMGPAPKYFDQIVGRRVKCPVQRGTATSWDLFEDE